MRYVVPLALLLVCLLAVPAHADTKPASLKELGRSLDDLAKRIGDLITEAGKDPDERKIQVYLDYTPDQLRIKKREVHVEDLVKFMVDPKKNFNVRIKAKDAIAGGTLRGDPDLSRAEKKRGMSKRAWFSNQFLVANLDHEDARTRKMCKDLLDNWWRGNANVANILAYDVGEKKTWSKAKRAWTKMLRKK